MVLQNNQVSSHWKPGSNTVVVDKFEAISFFWASPDFGETLGDIELYVTTGQDICVPEIRLEASWDDEYYDYSDDFSYNEYYSGTQIDVVYQCQRPGIATFLMVIPVKIETERGQTTKRIEVAWGKNCDSGPRRGLHVGTEESIQDVVQDGAVLEPWKSGTSLVPASVSFTNFFLRVEHGSQTYSINIDATNPEILEVHSRGYAGVPNMVSESDWDHDLTILYHCLSTGKSVITLTLKTPPFNEMVWSWEKLCGGEHQGGISIGLSPSTAGVLRDGQIVPGFSKFIAKATDRRTDFYLYTTEDVRQQYDGVVITATPGGALKPVVRINDRAPEPGFLTQEPVKLTVYYECLKKADTEVTVTLLFPPYKMVELSWHKRCVKLNPLVEEQVWSSGQLLALFAVFTLGIGFSALFLKKYSKDRKHN